MNNNEFTGDCVMTNAQYNGLIEAIILIFLNAESTEKAVEQVRSLKAKE